MERRGFEKQSKYLTQYTLQASKLMTTPNYKMNLDHLRTLQSHEAAESIFNAFLVSSNESEEKEGDSSYYSPSRGFGRESQRSLLDCVNSGCFQHIERLRVLLFFSYILAILYK